MLLFVCKRKSLTSKLWYIWSISLEYNNLSTENYDLLPNNIQESIDSLSLGHCTYT